MFSSSSSASSSISSSTITSSIHQLLLLPSSLIATTNEIATSVDIDVNAVDAINAVNVDAVDAVNVDAVNVVVGEVIGEVTGNSVGEVISEVTDKVIGEVVTSGGEVTGIGSGLVLFDDPLIRTMFGVFGGVIVLLIALSSLSNNVDSVITNVAIDFEYVLKNNGEFRSTYKKIEKELHKANYELKNSSACEINETLKTTTKERNAQRRSFRHATEQGQQPNQRKSSYKKGFNVGPRYKPIADSPIKL